MKDVLDFFTHLGNYSVPIDTRLATIIAAGNDAYIPIDGVSHFFDVWDDRCDIRIIKGIGHVEAYLRSSVWTEDRFRYESRFSFENVNKVKSQSCGFY